MAQVSEDPDVLVVSSYPLALSCLEERREQVTKCATPHLITPAPLGGQLLGHWRLLCLQGGP